MKTHSINTDASFDQFKKEKEQDLEKRAHEEYLVKVLQEIQVDIQEIKALRTNVPGTKVFLDLEEQAGEVSADMRTILTQVRKAVRFLNGFAATSDRVRLPAEQQAFKKEKKIMILSVLSSMLIGVVVGAAWGVLYFR